MSKGNAARTKLKAFLKDQRIFDYDQHFNEIFGRNDRLVALVGGDSLERALIGVLRSKMVSLSTTEYNAIFTGQGAPLSSFSSKINLSYALGIINRDIKSNLEIIKDIRNAFAHCSKPISFGTEEVIAVCKLLKFHTYDDPLGRVGHRHRFMACCVETGRAIWDHQLRGQTPQPPPSSP